MKTFKHYIAGMALIALAAGFAGCQDDVDAPAMEVPVAKSTPNTTIAELKAMYWQDTDNYAATIGDPDDPTKRIVIHGRVISSDEESNIYKSLIIQDETAALAFSINSYNLYLSYRQGQDIVMDVTGMYIGKYSGLMQMGMPDWYERGNCWQISFMAPEYFNLHAELNGLPEPKDVEVLQIPAFSMIGTTPEDQQKYQSQLVCLQNVQFVDGGKDVFSVYHSSGENRVITDANGATMNVRTSGYSTFWNTTLPEGNIDLTGILSFFNNAWQFLIIDGDGWTKAPERPGAKDNPYTVDQAVDSELAGLTAMGWVKGYIVGAVAPGVETVESDDDIEWEAPTTLRNTLVIGQTAATKSLDHALVVYLTSGSAFEKYGNLRDNAGNLGKEIMVYGTLEKYLGTFGITGNNGTSSTFEIEGVEVSGGTIADGDGAQASPYNVAQLLAMNPTSTTEAVASGVWAKGYIVGFIPEVGGSTVLSNAVFTAEAAVKTNLVLGPTADCTDVSKCVGVQLPNNAIRTALNLADHPDNVGKELAIKGDVMKYCGGPGIKTPTEFTLEGGSSDTPDVPDTPTGTPTGEGTAASPYNSLKAYQVTTALAADATTAEDYYVTGKITAIKEVSTQYGNATYSITTDGTSQAFDIFRSYYLNGDKFTAADQIKVGDEVVVCGKLVNYKGNTPQMAQGGKIISINNNGGGDTPDTPDVPDTPVTPDTPSDESVTVTGNQLAAVVTEAVTIQGYTFKSDKNGGATAPAANDYNGVITIRLYADNTFTISGPKMAKIVFDLNGTGAKRYTTFTPNSGAVAEQKADDAVITWTGGADTVTFTVGHDATIGSDGPTKRGQVHIQNITIYPSAN